MGARKLLAAHHAPHAAAYREAGHWIDQPVPDFIAQVAASDPGRIAIVDAEGAVSYGELAETVRRLAAGLLNLGIEPGDVVALQLPNRREFVYFQQATARIGAVYLPLIPQLRGGDLEYMLGACEARAIVIPDSLRGFDHRSMIGDLRASVSALRHVFVVGAVADGDFIDVAAFLDEPWEATHGAAVEAMAVDPDWLRMILFTSGTESKPKGVLHTFNTAFYSHRLHRRFFALGPSDAVLTPSPVGHATGALFGVELGLFLGGKVVLQAEWDAARAVELIDRERCSLMWGATTFYNDLVNAANVRDHDLSSFRVACSAGAPIPRSLVTRAREVLGATLVAAYGQSEGQNVSINRLDDPIDKITGTDGRINPGIEFKVVDDEGRALPPGQAGEFAYRGPSVCHGYLEAEHSARAFDEDGYLMSGDLVEVDDDGYLRVVGRVKDIIIRGGENISPAEVEDLLFKHPRVRDVAVIGLPDQRLGQRSCAVVIANPGPPLVLDDITGYLAGCRIAKFKYPERLEVVESFPRTASGKVRKEVLREMLTGEP